MNKKYMMIVSFVGIILILVLLFISNEQNMKKDSYQFKVEYEKLNNKENKYKKVSRNLKIDSNNPIKYTTAKKLVQKIEDGETFVVYFGFPECPWCRSMIENLITAAKKMDIDTVYYVNIKEIRDVKEFKNGEIITTKEGTKDYKKLLEKLGSVLDDYELEDENGKTVSALEKRIYAPNVVSVVNGSAKEMTDGVSSKLKDPYAKISDEMKHESIKKLECIFKCLEESNICTSKTSC